MSKKDVMTIKEGTDGLSSKTPPSELAALMATRSVSCVATINAYSAPIVVDSTGERVQANMGDLLTTVVDSCDMIAEKNDFSGLERILTAQTLALNAIFNNLAQRASNADHLPNMERYLKLALKAQAQARCTAEALSTIKNPTPYINQANITQGHQQVNNTYASASGHTDRQGSTNELRGLRGN